jgi:hypothetical protein
MARGDKQGREEFRVVLSGVELTEKQRESLNGAIQQATLRAVADFDFGGDRTAALIPINPDKVGKLPPWWGGGTRGIIWIGDLPGSEFERLANLG